MPVIAQGRKQYIVPLDILFGWKNYKEKFPSVRIISYSRDEKNLIVEGVSPEKIKKIKGRKWA